MCKFSKENARPGLYLFADDTKLFTSNDFDLQNELNILHNWTVSHQLSLAPAKCEQLTLSRKIL